MTTFKEFCNKWINGCGAKECEYANNKVFARGKLPADICFIGEAPGYSEDAIGVPFIGPAGHLLDQIIERSVLEGVRYVICNMTCCIPLDLEEPGKLEQPTVDQVDYCAPRLVEFIEIARPKLIICVGNFSRDWLDTKTKGHIRLPLMDNGKQIPQECILHPAYILRRSISEQSMLVQQCIIRIRQAIDTHIYGLPED